MNFAYYLSILRARRWIVLWTFAVTVIVTIVVSLLLPKSYTATASLVINAKGADPVTGITLPVALMPGYMATQLDIITSHNVALKVVDKFNIANSPVAKENFLKATEGKGDIRDWYADQFLQNLNVEPSKESSVIQLNFKGADPKFAAALANAFAEAYIQTSLQLKVEPSRQAALWFDQQIKGLRLSLESAQTKLSAYQREHGIVAADERIDVETARLSELSSQLVAAQTQTYDSTSRDQQLIKGNAAEAPEILANSLIQGLKSQLVQSEAKLSDIAQHMDKNHPQYQAALTEVENLRKRISEEIAKTSSSIGQTARISQQREREIRGALAAQKDRVLALKRQHDDMAVLMREVENAQHMYDTAMQRFGQTSMEGQASQTDISLLNPAIPPIEHSSPKIFLNIILSMIMGGMLGMGFAFIAEMADRRVRSANDLSLLMGLTVLGVLEPDKKKSTGFIGSLQSLPWLRRSKSLSPAT